MGSTDGLSYARYLAVERVDKKWAEAWNNIKEIASRPIENDNTGLISVLCSYISSEIQGAINEESSALWALRSDYFPNSIEK